MDEIRGILTKVLKRDEATGRLFATMRYESGFGLDSAKVGGASKELKEGDYFVARGDWKEMPATDRFPASRLFNAKSIQPDLPTNKAGAAQWLAAMFDDPTHGATTERIKALVERLGPRAAHLCEANPEHLLDVSRNPPSFRNAILKTWARAVSGRMAFRLMEAAGVDNRAARSIYDAFLDRTHDVVRANPYQASRVKNVGFANVDKIGRHVKIGANDDRRVAAALVESLDGYRGEGSTYADVDAVAARMDSAFGIDANTAADYMIRHANARTAPFVLDEKGDALIAMLRELRDGEAAIAEKVAALLGGGRRNPASRVEPVAKSLFAQEKYARFDPIQRAAVAMALAEPLSVLTGGPGTGKSAVSEVVVAGAKLLDPGKILLCAPTGKAAKRLEEATGEKATTIHRLLEAKLDAQTGGTLFGRGCDKPLPAGCVVIVDEASMIDVPTMRGLVEAMPADGRLILVGDRNQLPSVDAGAVLADLLAARNGRGELVVPATELVNVYRQSRNSAIAKGAAEVRQGRLPMMTRQPVGGLALFEESQDRLVNTILAFVKNTCINPKSLNLRPHQFVVLAPQAKGTAGTWQLNRELSRILNPNGKPIPGIFRSPDDDLEMPVPRVGDRVMQTENDDENDVMNGDVGSVVDAGVRKTASGAERHVIVVRFDNGKSAAGGKEVVYPAGRWRNLILAYAMTIHKSQGSQYHTVIMPVTMAHEFMLDRSLLYTGWTRATDLLCLFGEIEALEKAVTTTDASARDTRLRDYAGAAATAADLRGRAAPPESERPPAAQPGVRAAARSPAPPPTPTPSGAAGARPTPPRRRPASYRPPAAETQAPAPAAPSAPDPAARPRGRPASWRPPAPVEDEPPSPSPSMP